MEQPPEGLTMKMYLLILLIGAIFTAIRFTSVPETTTKPLTQ